MYDYEFEDEYEEKPRHKKAAPTKKPKTKKADHKHQYRDCNVVYTAEDNFGKYYTLYSPARYCTICGNLECGWANLKNRNSINDKLPMFDVEMWGKKVKL